jgi:hypothetical protein
VLSRLPSDQERNIGIETLKELEVAWQGKPYKELGSFSADSSALETYCHSIFNSAAFLYVD